MEYLSECDGPAPVIHHWYDAYNAVYTTLYWLSTESIEIMICINIFTASVN